jgi:hypothetical protein
LKPAAAVGEIQRFFEPVTDNLMEKTMEYPVDKFDGCG